MVVDCGRYSDVDDRNAVGQDYSRVNDRYEFQSLDDGARDHYRLRIPAASGRDTVSLGGQTEF